MKNLVAIFIALAMPCLITAQNNFSKSYPLQSSKTIKLEFEYGDISIEKHSGSELLIEGNVYVNGESGVDNFKFDSNQTSSTLRIKVEADFEDVEPRLTIVKNDGTRIYKSGNNFNLRGYSDEEGVEKVINGVDVDAKFTIKVPSDVKLEVHNTYGDVSISEYWDKMNIHSTYGSVDLVLNNPPAQPNFRASSTYSDVDLTLPETANASLRMTTGFGQIFTDMNLETEIRPQSEGCENGEDIKATLNKAVGSINLDARYSNVYLRKKKI
jgi:hypothetical protein